MRVAVVLVMSIFLMFLAIAPSVGAASVERTLMPLEPGAGSEFDVILTIEDIRVGGIVESIPAGYTYLGSDCSSVRVSDSGDEIAFAILNESTITYRLRAPDTGCGSIIGIYEDFLAGETGGIAATPAGDANLCSGASGTVSTTTVQQTQTSSLWWAGALAAAGIAGLMRRGGDRR